MENPIKTAGKTAAKKNKPKPIVQRTIARNFVVTLKLFGSNVFFCEFATTEVDTRKNNHCNWLVRGKSRRIARERLSLTADLLKRAMQEGAEDETIMGFTAPENYAQEAPVSAIWINRDYFGYHLKVSDCFQTILFIANYNELKQLCDMFCRAIELFDNEINNLKS